MVSVLIQGCCSAYGWCGTTPEQCSGGSGGADPTDLRGDFNVGNWVCADPGLYMVDVAQHGLLILQTVLEMGRVESSKLKIGPCERVGFILCKH